MNIKVPSSVICSQFHVPPTNAVTTIELPQWRKAPCFCPEILLGLWHHAAWLALLLSFPPLLAQDFTVISPGFFYSINNQSPNPTLTLVRGKTYTFSVATFLVHPFQILSSGTVVGNNISLGTIMYTVAMNAPATNSLGY